MSFMDNEDDDIALDDAVYTSLDAAKAKPKTAPLPQQAAKKAAKPNSPYFRIAQIIRLVANETNMGWRTRAELAGNLARYFEVNLLHDEDGEAIKFSHEEFYREILQVGNC